MGRRRPFVAIGIILILAGAAVMSGLLFLLLPEGVTVTPTARVRAFEVGGGMAGIGLAALIVSFFVRSR
jgi:hypothetical protein